MSDIGRATEYTFTLGAFGGSFATRGRGAELREQLMEARGAATAVVIDFDRVDKVTYSFADEFLGRLAEAQGLEVSAVHMPPSVASVVERATGRRGLVLH